MYSDWNESFLSLFFDCMGFEPTTKDMKQVQVFLIDLPPGQRRKPSIIRMQSNTDLHRFGHGM